MPDDEEQDRKLPDNEKDFLKLREADIFGGMVLKSLSEQNMSNIRKVSVRQTYYYNVWMNERFNEKSQDKKGHKATYTCFK